MIVAAVLICVFFVVSVLVIAKFVMNMKKNKTVVDQSSAEK